MRVVALALLWAVTRCTQDFDAFLGDGAVDAKSDGAASDATSDAVTDAPSDGPLACTEPGAVMFQGHCYFELTTAQTETDAATACQNVGAHLVTITGSAEQATVAAIGPGDQRWIGLFRMTGAANDADYAWIDGEARAGFSDWSAGEPDGSGMCVRMIAAGTWSDDPCTNTHDAICERE